MHIVFIHVNACDHLSMALCHAKTSFPQATITLLANAHAFEHVKRQVRDVSFIDFVDIGEFSSDELSTFQRSYQHFSANDYFVERLCFERWFYLKSWMAKRNLSDCVYLDSDVLLYPSGHHRLFAPETAGLALVIPRSDERQCRWFASGHVSRWSRDVLDQFCSFVVHSFQDEATLKRYAEIRRLYKVVQSPFGVSDMTSLYFFQQKRNDTDNLFEPKHDCVFDAGFASSEAVPPYEYKMKHGAKFVTFVGEVPHLTLLASPPVLIPAGGLHFQGSSKFRMQEYYRGPKLRVPLVKTFKKNCKVHFKRIVDQVWPGTRHDIKALQKEIRECKVLIQGLYQQAVYEKEFGDKKPPTP